MVDMSVIISNVKLQLSDLLDALMNIASSNVFLSSLTVAGIVLVLIGSISTLIYGARSVKESQAKAREFAQIQNSVISGNQALVTSLKSQLSMESEKISLVESVEALKSVRDVLSHIAEQEQKLKGSHYDAFVSNHVELNIIKLSIYSVVIGSLLLLPQAISNLFA
ncbi:hypothetical protein ACRZ5S_22900 (plasmid) [Vibrio scophthalmi]|uniref:hypothetical protein n=1 Tax=Vibrio scophthalmi TaxID=45658 RepID=UPI003EBDBC46